jgi:hypothetical protein
VAVILSLGLAATIYFLVFFSRTRKKYKDQRTQQSYTVREAPKDSYGLMDFKFGESKKSKKGRRGDATGRNEFGTKGRSWGKKDSFLKMRDVDAEMGSDRLMDNGRSRVASEGFDYIQEPAYPKPLQNTSAIPLSPSTTAKTRASRFTSKNLSFLSAYFSKNSPSRKSEANFLSSPTTPKTGETNQTAPFLFPYSSANLRASEIVPSRISLPFHMQHQIYKQTTKPLANSPNPNDTWNEPSLPSIPESPVALNYQTTNSYVGIPNPPSYPAPVLTHVSMLQSSNNSNMASSSLQYSSHAYHPPNLSYMGPSNTTAAYASYHSDYTSAGPSSSSAHIVPAAMGRNNYLESNYGSFSRVENKSMLFSGFETRAATPIQTAGLESCSGTSSMGVEGKEKKKMYESGEELPEPGFLLTMMMKGSAQNR